MREERVARAGGATGCGLGAARQVDISALIAALPTRGATLNALIDGISHDRIRVLADEPDYERLILVSRRTMDGSRTPNAQHVVEAGLTLTSGAPCMLGGGALAAESTAGSRAAGGAVTSELQADAWWTMLDLTMEDLQASGLAVIGVRTLISQYKPALQLLDYCQAQGGLQYAIRVDPSVPDPNGDALDLTEQLLAESALSWLLSAEAVARLEAKRGQPPTNDEFRRAMAAMEFLKSNGE